MWRSGSSGKLQRRPANDQPKKLALAAPVCFLLETVRIIVCPQSIATCLRSGRYLLCRRTRSKSAASTDITSLDEDKRKSIASRYEDVRLAVIAKQIVLHVKKLSRCDQSSDLIARGKLCPNKYCMQQILHTCSHLFGQSHIRTPCTIF